MALMVKGDDVPGRSHSIGNAARRHHSFSISGTNVDDPGPWGYAREAHELRADHRLVGRNASRDLHVVTPMTKPVQAIEQALAFVQKARHLDRLLQGIPMHRPEHC